MVNAPPANRSVPLMASVDTAWLTPLPSADQLAPSQRATLAALRAPAVLKSPPTNRSLPLTASAETEALVAALLTPLPRADQAEPSQRATPLTVTPSASKKGPPAKTLVPLTARARTASSMPPPRADQLEPFHLATLLAVTVP